MPEAVLGLGGNLGARRAIFRAAAALLASTPGCRVLGRSRLYETPPLGPPQPDYLNAALRVSWSGTAPELLARAQQIEQQLGRERHERWGQRTLDIDVLYWSAGAVQTEALQVPHPELEQRTFALAPLLDVAPELAAVWGTTLHALGGPPAVASPEWPVWRREGAYVCGAWQRDEAELASQLVELLAMAEEPSARVAAATERGARLATHAFTGPAELFDAAGQCWLVAVVDDALRRGFAVKSAAIVVHDAVHTAGVLLGYDGSEPGALGALVHELEGRAGDEQRVKMLLDTPERGFEFNGSGTM